MVVEAKPSTPSLREASRLFARLFALMRSYWWMLAKGLLASLAVGMLGLLTPLLLKMLIDEAFPARDIGFMQVLVLSMAVIQLVSAVIGSVRGFYTQAVTARLNSEMSLMLFNHIQHLPMRFFEERRTGEVLSRIGDLRSAIAAVQTVFETVLLRGVYLILIPPVLLALHWKLAVMSIIALPFTTVVSLVAGRMLRSQWQQSADAAAAVSGYQIEALSHIRTLKAMGLERHVFEQARATRVSALHAQLRASGWGALVGGVNGILRMAAMALFTWYGWRLILTGEITLGSYMAFTAYLGYFTGPINRFAAIVSGFHRAAVSLGRSFDYLDAEPESDPARALHSRDSQDRQVSSIAFQGLGFSYSSDRAALTDVTFDVPPGSVTALVGPSGAGKSTLLRLVVGFDRPSSGKLLVDGVSIDRHDLAELRRQISVVWQEVTLLKGTLWENLTLGADDVNRRDVDDAVEACQIRSMVDELPKGYDTPIAEWGSTLSGGQRQRIALARALLRRSSIVLLDEATSNLDVPTEMQVLAGLFTRMRGRTVLFVTHRAATAVLADRAIVIDHGRIVGVGTHESLSTACPLYAEMQTVGGVEHAHRFRRVTEATG